MTKIKCPRCGKFKCPSYKTVTKTDVIVRYRKCGLCHYNFKSVELTGDVFDKIKNIKKIAESINIGTDDKTKQVRLKI